MKPHKKTELLTGNLLDHWEYEVNDFGGGNQEYYSKDTEWRVRPVRAF